MYVETIDTKLGYINDQIHMCKDTYISTYIHMYNVHVYRMESPDLLLLHLSTYQHSIYTPHS